MCYAKIVLNHGNIFTGNSKVLINLSKPSNEYLSNNNTKITNTLRSLKLNPKIFGFDCDPGSYAITCQINPQSIVQFNEFQCRAMVA